MYADPAMEHLDYFLTPRTSSPVISEGVSFWFQSCCRKRFEDVFLEEAEVLLVVGEVGRGEGGEELLPDVRISGEEAGHEASQLAVRESSQCHTGADLFTPQW